MDGTNIFMNNTSMDADLRSRMRGFERRPIVYEKRPPAINPKSISDISLSSANNPKPVESADRVDFVASLEAPPNSPINSFEADSSASYKSPPVAIEPEVIEIAQQPNLMMRAGQNVKLAGDWLLDIKERALDFADKYLRFRPRPRTLVIVAVITVAALGAYRFYFSHSKIANQPSNLQVVEANAATAPVSAQAVKEYSVAADQPKIIDITYLGVHARVKALAEKAGVVQTAFNVNDVAWDSSSEKLGEPGTSVMAGQISDGSTKGAFYNLVNVRVGDIIQITRGDNQIFKYQVMKTETYNSQNVDMAMATKGVDQARSCLNLVAVATENSSVNPGFNQRVIVYTEQI
ncbi:MAG TPA: class F sortase [Candidatus Saccharimonadales bacterium]|nr:class F sortase [Candidatus Saccharimonadales bacterium]